MRIADLYRLDTYSARTDESAGLFDFFNVLSCENFLDLHFYSNYTTYILGKSLVFLMGFLKTMYDYIYCNDIESPFICLLY